MKFHTQNEINKKIGFQTLRKGTKYGSKAHFLKQGNFEVLEIPFNE